jgi:threonine/homoserine/homoserine lactone efflux protein
MPFSAFFAAALALNLAPGPDMTYVAARSLAQGRRAGIVSALGIAVGCAFHIGAAALGVAVFLRAVPQAYAVVRFVGAAYLIYLGVNAIRQSSVRLHEARVAPASDLAIFRQGVLTNILNPKVALFFLAFLPQFVDPALAPAWLQVLVLGVYFNIQGTLVNVLVACLAGSVRSALQGGRARVWMQRISGIVLVGLGLRLASAPSR